jgi:JmjC domain-containing histone demethylation protein 1D/E/F/lysine-specific demethylase PHF8
MSRPLAKLDFPEEAKTENRSHVVFDRQNYCICRRGDDGMLFMVECDSCKEWFHGSCVGIYDETDLQSYTCIGCAMAFNNFSEEPNKNDEENVGLRQ